MSKSTNTSAVIQPDGKSVSPAAIPAEDRHDLERAATSMLERAWDRGWLAGYEAARETDVRTGGPAATTREAQCAAWCMSAPHCDAGRECHYHPETLDLDAVFETKRRAARGRAAGPARVILAVGRLLNPDFRNEAIAPADSCVITLGIEDGERHEDLDLTISEARELARRLTDLCERADLDARTVFK